MATVNYSVVPSSTGAPWSGTFVVSSFSNIVKNDLPTVTAPNGFSFSTASFGEFGPYVTWRTYTGGQFPNAGYSFDIWSINLVLAIRSNATWTTLKTTSTYSLTSDKHVLIYNYDVPTAPFFGLGGTITFT
jgi:hypothetical protein